MDNINWERAPKEATHYNTCNGIFYKFARGEKTKMFSINNGEQLPAYNRKYEEQWNAKFVERPRNILHRNLHRQVKYPIFTKGLGSKKFYIQMPDGTHSKAYTYQGAELMRQQLIQMDSKTNTRISIQHANTEFWKQIALHRDTAKEARIKDSLETQMRGTITTRLVPTKRTAAEKARATFNIQFDNAQLTTRQAAYFIKCYEFAKETNNGKV